MVHVGALPGTPKNTDSVEKLTKQVLYEAEILAKAGVDAVMIENMHDVPYLNREVNAEIVASMTAIAITLRRLLNIPLGIQILAGANKAALAVALAAGFDFIRAEGFVFGHLADEGWMNSDAGELLRYRKQIGAEHIRIFTDVKKKHSSHAVSADVSAADTAKAAEFFLSDGIIVTGNVTGEEPLIEEVRMVKKSVKIPVIIGSGIGVGNIHKYWELADAFIVGSALKKDGNWQNEVSKSQATEFMLEINELRK